MLGEVSGEALRSSEGGRWRGRTERCGRSRAEGKQSAVCEDQFNFAVDVDLEKLRGLKQLTFRANIFQIDSGGLSCDPLFNFMVVSGIEALPTKRLYEIWLEQKWGTKLALRAGRPSRTQRFLDCGPCCSDRELKSLVT
jgi:porin